MFGFWFWLVLILIGLYLYRRHSVPKDFPPGPWGVPIFGYLPFLKSHAYLHFHNLAKKYGPILGLRLGKFRVVILHDYNTMKEAFKLDSFTGKGKEMEFNREFGGRISKDHAHGVLSSEGREWVEQRRFTLKNLRDLGYGKTSMDSKLAVELEELIEGFKKENGKPSLITKRFNVVIINALFQMCVGERYNHDDKLIQEMAEGMEGPFMTAVYPGVFYMMPEIMRLFPRYFDDLWNKFLKSVEEMATFMDIRVTDHEKTYQEDSMRDFTDVYLREMKATTDPTSSFYGNHGRQSLITVLMDMLAAGAHTTSTGMAWTLLYLVRHPDVMKKVQEEIDIVIGRNRLPSLDDRKSLNYMEAVINETLRVVSFVPLGDPHCVTEDTYFEGYFFSKGTFVFGNLYSILHDPKRFKNPEKFIPERFLDEDGKFKLPADFTPFGIGKRVCPGEILARVQIFYFITGLIQRFNFAPVEGEPLPSFEPRNGGEILIPKDYKLQVTEK